MGRWMYSCSCGMVRSFVVFRNWDWSESRSRWFGDSTSWDYVSNSSCGRDVSEFLRRRG